MPQVELTPEHSQNSEVVTVALLKPLAVLIVPVIPEVLLGCKTASAAPARTPPLKAMEAFIADAKSKIKGVAANIATNINAISKAATPWQSL